MIRTEVIFASKAVRIVVLAADALIIVEIVAAKIVSISDTFFPASFRLSNNTLCIKVWNHVISDFISEESRTSIHCLSNDWIHLYLFFLIVYEAIKVIDLFKIVCQTLNLIDFIGLTEEGKGREYYSS